MNQFETLQNPSKMKDLFQLQLPGFSNPSLTISSCEIEHLHFKRSYKEGFQHKASVGIGYVLDITDHARNMHGQLNLYGKAYQGGRSLRIFESLPPVPLASPSFGEPLVHLPDLDMIVWAFPNDPQLRHLPELMDLQKVRAQIPKLNCWAPKGCSFQNFRVLSAAVVRYKPELRCTIRYDLEWDTQSTSIPFTIYAKTFVAEHCKTIYQRMEYFWEQSLNGAGEFFVAQPLGLSEEMNTIWQSGVSGCPLTEVINQTNYRDLLDSVARDLACFHKSHFSISATLTNYNRLAEVQKRLAKIFQTLPEYQETLMSLMRRLEKDAITFSTALQTLVHGDFHMEQLLLSDGKIVLFDFDDLALGDPLQDVADFMAQLHFYSFDLEFVQRMSLSFWRSYAKQVEWHVPMARLNWHMRVHFIKKACREFLQQKPHTSNRMEYFLSLAREGVLTEKHYSEILS